MQEALINKLFLLSFDPGATEFEALASFKKLRAITISNRITGHDVAGFLGTTKTVIRTIYQNTDKSIVLEFGKYKGRTIRSVADTEEGRKYLEWVLRECTRISQTTRIAIEKELF